MNALYLEGGVRGVEIGSVMFGKPHADGTEIPAQMELVRLAVSPPDLHPEPHRLRGRGGRSQLPTGPRSFEGYRIVEQAPWLRHFTARFEPL